MPDDFTPQLIGLPRIRFRSLRVRLGPRLSHLLVGSAEGKWPHSIYVKICLARLENVHLLAAVLTANAAALATDLMETTSICSFNLFEMFAAFLGSNCSWQK